MPQSSGCDAFDRSANDVVKTLNSPAEKDGHPVSVKTPIMFKYSVYSIVFMFSFYEVMIERDFSSAHQLRGYKGKCENLHGHNYKIEIYARGEELNMIGLLIDFVDLKRAADDIVKYFDHRNINELPPFDEELNPSAENLARYIWNISLRA